MNEDLTSAKKKVYKAFLLTGSFIILTGLVIFVVDNKLKRA
jgi:hypothetical protein